MKISIRKIHKFLGLSAGIVILVLSVSGFVLNHDNWKFFNTTTFSFVPNETIKLNSNTFNSYFVDESDKNHIIVSSSRGLYESFDGEIFIKQLDEVSYDVRNINDNFFVATANGIYKKNNNLNKWEIFLLEGKFISTLNISEKKLIIVEDKREIYVYDLEKNLLLNNSVNIDNLNDDITLSRFIRDIHYARGLFDGDISLYINDMATILFIVSSISGFLFWLFVKYIKGRKYLKSIIKKILAFHSNILMIIFIIPFLLLSITGIFLDHSNSFRNFLNSIKINNNVLPPVYHTLKADIWGANYDDGYFYIGNRYGVYKSKDLNNFEQISKGFAYKMIHKNDKLYISGMGSPNRVIEKNHISTISNAPHMFKDINVIDGNEVFFSTQNKKQINLPIFNDVSLYTLMLSMHNGSFFSTWWIWINDYASIAIIILVFTGFYRWYLRTKANYYKIFKINN